MNADMQPSFRQKQGYILIGITAAALVTAFVFWQAFSKAPPQIDFYQVLPSLLKYFSILGLCLAAGIGGIANARFLNATAIDGNPVPENYGFMINQRYLQNTLEQSVLAAFVWLSCAVVHPAVASILIPYLAWMFLIGRASFWIGYRISPPARAFGMALTVYPTVVTLIWTLIGLFS